MKWALAALLLVAACGGGDDDYAGLGKFRFGTTELKHVKKVARCDPTKASDGRAVTWCYGLTPFKIGKRTAEMDLYFLGADDDAPLIEIQLHVRGCDEEELVGWMRTNFGQQVDERAKRFYWQNKHLWAAALAPSEPGRCEVHFLPLSEATEIARIKAL